MADQVRLIPQHWFWACPTCTDKDKHIVRLMGIIAEQQKLLDSLIEACDKNSTSFTRMEKVAKSAIELAQTLV